MKRYILLLLVVLYLPLSSQAQQVPGLLGKRLTIFYNADFFYNTLYFKYNELDQEFGPFSDELITLPDEYYPNIGKYTTLQHSIQFDYALSKVSSIGVGLSYFRNGYGSIDELYNKNIISRGLSIGWKKFYGGGLNIAPLGYYKQYTFHLNFVDDHRTQNNVFGPASGKIGERLVIVPAFTFGVGKQAVLYKSLLINYGVETGIVFPSPVPGAREESLSNIYTSLSGRSEQSPWSRMALFYLFRFKLGIGLAAF